MSDTGPMVLWFINIILGVLSLHDHLLRISSYTLIFLELIATCKETYNATEFMQLILQTCSWLKSKKFNHLGDGNLYHPEMEVDLCANFTLYRRNMAMTAEVFERHFYFCKHALQENMIGLKC